MNVMSYSPPNDVEYEIILSVVIISVATLAIPYCISPISLCFIFFALSKRKRIIVVYGCGNFMLYSVRVSISKLYAPLIILYTSSFRFDVV